MPIPNTGISVDAFEYPLNIVFVHHFAFAIRKETTSSIIELHSLIAAIVSIVAMTAILAYSLAEKMKFDK